MPPLIQISQHVIREAVVGCIAGDTIRTIGWGHGALDTRALTARVLAHLA